MSEENTLAEDMVDVALQYSHNGYKAGWWNGFAFGMLTMLVICSTSIWVTLMATGP